VNYREALAWLYGTQRFGIKLGLDNAARLFEALQISQPRARVVHVAGTNGKGSVCAMAAAICAAQGHRTGLFTSPHLITYRERIRVNGEMINETDVAENLSAIRQLVSSWEPHPTFFEITTALALRYFQHQRCDVMILETGLGGRLDATNVITPAVSVLTPVDLDHQEWLGNTIDKIAGEKAGIIKPRVPVVSAEQLPEAESVIRARAVECEAPLEFISELVSHARLGLTGVHQQRNAALAIAALRAANIDVPPGAIVRGLAAVDWPARFQRVDERMVIDGAHNPAAARVLAQTWKQNFGDQRATVIAGMLRDKNAADIWQELKAVAERVLLPRFQSERATPANDLESVIRRTSPDLPVECFDSINHAIETARKHSAPILVTGSLHFAGEVLATLRGEPAAYEECAQ
jgi:dihydrofolate synthase/folylpolyglutamate synthase